MRTLHEGSCLRSLAGDNMSGMQLTARRTLQFEQSPHEHKGVPLVSGNGEANLQGIQRKHAVLP